MLATYDTLEPSMLTPRYHAARVWRTALQYIRNNGHDATEEGYTVREVVQYSLQMNTNYPIVDSEYRNLPRRYLHGQAYRLLSFAASNDVVTSAKYAQDLFHNAPVIIEKLKREPHATYTGMTLRDWLPYPSYAGPPFAVSVHAYVRRARLQLCVYTHASHAWEGLPYDLFSFAMLTQYLALHIGIGAGMLYYTTSRLYLPAQYDNASRVILARESDIDDCLQVGPWRSTVELAEQLRVSGGF